MKHFSLLFCIMIASLFSFSQVENFDLSKYKLPNIKRQQLDFDFQSGGQNSSSKYFSYYPNYSDTIKDVNNRFTGNYNLGYSFYLNTRNIQSLITAGTYGNYSKTKQENINYSSQDNYIFQNNLSFNYDLKYFLTPTNWFIATTPYYAFSYYNYKEHESDLEYKNLYNSVKISIGGGKGRIEQVQDFRHAVLLIEELDKRRVSTRNISEAEMIELSTLISQLKNKRFFDSRKQKETELVALDSFFVDKGIIDNKSIQYFTGLEDIWTYGGLQVRESGKQVLFSITPGYVFDKDLEHIENNINEEILMHYNLSFVAKNPISIKWQGNYRFGLIHEYLNRLQQQNSNLGEKSYESRALVNGEFGYYPNTRTNFSLSSTVSLSNMGDEKILDKEKYGAHLQITTSGYYYISEKLRAGYSVSFYTSKYGIFNNELDNTYYKTLYYSFNLNYAIF
ncbi:MAG TPA: hypothetical protein PLC80_06410 [Draconibacterium sp.]|nr:hypothetical protein [Draconibacterium sp.]